MKKVLKPQSNKLILWKALNAKTRRTVDKDYDFAQLSQRIKEKNISSEDIIFSFDLSKGIWIL